MLSDPPKRANPTIVLYAGHKPTVIAIAEKTKYYQYNFDYKEQGDLMR
jgi:hypothetical protein